MTTFNECIQKRIDITAYEPDSKEEMDEFLRILDHNHRIIHQCSRESGFRIQSDPHYRDAIEAELWDSLNALRKGKAYAQLGSADQLHLEMKAEAMVRYADHLPDINVERRVMGTALTGTMGLVVGGTILTVVEAVPSGLVALVLWGGVSAMFLAPVLAAGGTYLYLQHRE